MPGKCHADYSMRRIRHAATHYQRHYNTGVFPQYQDGETSYLARAFGVGTINIECQMPRGIMAISLQRGCRIIFVAAREIVINTFLGSTRAMFMITNR